MSITKKIILVVAILFLAILLTITGIITYYLASPERTKDLVRKTIETASGLQVTIKSIDYSIFPINFTVRELTLRPVKDAEGTGASIPEVAANLHREGSFGHKILVVDAIRIKTPVVHICQQSTVPSVKSRTSTVASRLIKRMTEIFFFRDIEFRKLDVSDGALLFVSDRGTFTLSKVTGRINEENLIEIACESRMCLTEKDIEIILPDLHITTQNSISSASPDIGASVKTCHAMFKQPGLALENINLNTDIKYEYRGKRLVCNFLEIDGKGYVERGEKPSSCDVEAKIAGVIDLEMYNIDADRFSIHAKDLFGFQGAVKADLKGRGVTFLEITDGFFFPLRFEKLLPEHLRTAMDTAYVGGRLQIRGTLHGTKGDDAWKYDCNLSARLKHNPAFLSAGDFRIEGTLAGEIMVRGEIINPTFNADITASDCTVESPMINLAPCKARAKIDGKFPHVNVYDLVLTAPKTRLTAGEKLFYFKDTHITSEKGSFDFGTKEFTLPRVLIDSAILKHIELWGKGEGKTCQIGIKGVNTGILEFAHSHGLIPEGWTLKGSDAIHVSANKRKEKSWSLNAELHMNKCNFEDDDAVFIGENLDANMLLHCNLDLGDNSVLFDGLTKVTRGEVLLDRFYLDLGKHTLSSSFKGSYGRHGRAVALHEMNFNLQDRLSTDFSGTYIVYPNAPEGSVSIRLHDTPIFPLFETIVKEPFKAENPALGSIALEGTISALFEIEKKKTGTRILGHLYVKEGRLSKEDKNINFSNLSFDLPIWIQTGKAIDAGKPLTGKLEIGSAKVPFISEQAFSLPLKAGPNSLCIESSTEVSTPGGTVLVGPLSCSDITGPRLAVESSITIHDLDLRPFLPETIFRNAAGNIQGDLDSVKLTGNTLSTHGELTAEIFGGKAIISNMSVSSLFSSGPLISFDARLNDLNLAEMTTNTSFGKIEGTLQGYIEGLEIAYGQPQRFDLLLETIPQEGVNQRISVKAVDNIAKIGGGQSPFVGLAGTISSLFKEFPYEKIGVRASLENDIFKINGTIKEDGKEYIIKRSGFSGVNIVNQNPDNRISFKDMVKRVQRVTKEGTSPVIK